MKMMKYVRAIQQWHIQLYYHWSFLQIVREAYASVLLIKMIDENRNLSTSNLTSLQLKWLERFHPTPLHDKMDLQVRQLSGSDIELLFRTQKYHIIKLFFLTFLK
jgi:hypothetical protein